MPKETESPPSPTQFFHESEVSSTQDSVLEKIIRGSEIDPWVLLLADTQIQGRGTRRRDWQTSTKPHDQLILSFGRKMSADFSGLPVHGLSLLVGEVLYKSIMDLGINCDRLFLKWPNDLMLQSGPAGGEWRKIGGILCEYKKNCLIVGVGLNLRSTPDTISTAASLLDADPETEMNADFRKQLSFTIFNHFATGYTQWRQNPALFMQELSLRLNNQMMKPQIGGRAIVKKTGVECRVGGISPEGYLLLYRDTDSSPICIKSSDEVRFYQFSPA